MSDKISQRLTEERARLGFSQADIARRLGISRETMRKWENGLAVITTEALENVDEFGFDVLYIITGRRSSAVSALASPNVSIGSVSGVGVAQDGANVQVINTTRHITKTEAVVRPGDEHISDSDAAVLTRLVNDIVDLENSLQKNPKSYRAVWAALNAHCRVTRYRLIAKGDFQKARKYLDQWIGRLNSKSAAPKIEGDAWRKRRYSYIKVNTRDDASSAALLSLLKSKYSVNSISELNDEELESVYRSITRKRNKAVL